jgi:hypothetical protein
MNGGPRPLSSILENLVKPAGLWGRLLPVERTVVVCHPDSARLLEASFPVPKRDPSLPPIWAFPGSWPGLGIEIREDVNCPKWHKKWVAPASSGRFAGLWEYGLEDEEWAAKLGIGRYEDDVTRPWFMELTTPNFLAPEPAPEWMSGRKEYGCEVKIPPSASIYLKGMF